MGIFGRNRQSCKLSHSTGCQYLCHVYNHAFDPQDYLNGIRIERVTKFTRGSFKSCEYIIDTHDAPVVQQYGIYMPPLYNVLVQSPR